MRVIFSIILAFAAVAAQAQGYYAMVDSSEVYIGEKDWEKAEYYIKKALEAEPDNSNNSLLLSNLATVQRYAGKTQEAVRNYSLALFMTPNAVTLLKNRASLYLQIDSIDLAYADYERVIALDNRDLESLYNHGMIAIEKKKMGISRDDFDRLKSVSPKSYYAVNGDAVWHMVSGNYDRAVEGFSKIIEARPGVEAYMNRADCYMAMKKLVEADKDIRAAIELDSSNGQLYMMKAALDRLRYDEMQVSRDLELAEKYGVSKDEIRRWRMEKR
ncbi:MAG: tetratricopeptide repeat protein [Bacteroidales bacterium]|nr:tetratricopeptide repeat protein [Bacteroidales bacterium]